MINALDERGIISLHVRSLLTNLQISYRITSIVVPGPGLQGCAPIMVFRTRVDGCYGTGCTMLTYFIASSLFEIFVKFGSTSISPLMKIPNLIVV